MSFGYTLICLDCNRGVLLGKSDSIKYADSPNETWGFGNLGSMRSGVWEPVVQGCAPLQHFLMVHRAHELRVLSDAIEKFTTEYGLPASYPTDADDEPDLNLTEFYRNVGPVPRADLEADALPADLIERLRHMSRSSSERATGQ